MSILLVGLPDLFAVKLVQRLIDEGDEVRILVAPSEDPERWRRLGAHPAAGTVDDDDLVERAATNVRTMVVGEQALSEGEIRGLISGARKAQVGRIVVCAPQPQDVLTHLQPTDLEYVVITTAKRPLVGRAKTRIPLSKLAEAVDAADDLGGNLRLELDLSVEKSWQILRVLPPDG